MSHDGRADVASLSETAAGKPASRDGIGAAATCSPEPPHVRLTRLHNTAVEAARKHAKAPYNSVASRKTYRTFIDANTKFVNELARALGGSNAQTQ